MYSTDSEVHFFSSELNFSASFAKMHESLRVELQRTGVLEQVVFLDNFISTI